MLNMVMRRRMNRRVVELNEPVLRDAKDYSDEAK